MDKNKMFMIIFPNPKSYKNEKKNKIKYKKKI